MDRIFFKTEITDAYTGYPVYVFDTLYLPDPEVIDYDQFIPTLMATVPAQKYIVVMFLCGLNKILWLYGVKFMKAFLDPLGTNLDRLHKIIAVHELWFVRLISQILTNFLLSKKHFLVLGLPNLRLGLLTLCNLLEELSGYVDLTRLKISLNVYKHDAELTMLPNLRLQSPQPHIDTSSFGLPIFHHHFYQIFHIVALYGPRAEALFLRPGNRLSTEILYHCVLRNQLIWINDWDLHCIGLCFKRLLAEVPRPLISVPEITLPMSDDLNYTATVFRSFMAQPHDFAQVLYQLLDLCHKMIENHQTTHHSPLLLAKSFANALTHESTSKKSQDTLSIAVRFVKNVLAHWPALSPAYSAKFRSISDVASGKPDHPDDSYNLSHDITIDEDDSNSVSVNTQNILDSDTALAKPPLPRKANKSLSDVSNILLQWPPQKYRFEKKSVPKPITPPLPPRRARTVVRGRKVGELTKLFEARSQAIELLETFR